MEFMFTGINMFLALTQTHFSLSHQARVKMSSEKGPKIYLCPRTQTLLLLLSLWRALRKETLKKWQQNTPKNIFFTSAVRKCQRTLKWLLNFDWLLGSYDYLILTFYWFISYTFQPIKCATMPDKVIICFRSAFGTFSLTKTPPLATSTLLFRTLLNNKNEMCT